MNKDSKNNSLPEIYQAVGSALSNWTRVETQLYQIFNISLNLVVMQPGGGFSMGGEVPTAVLDSVDGFRAKMEMINAAINSALDGLDEAATGILNDWAKAQTRVNSLHRSRSRLAHWTVSARWKDGARHKVRLMPPHYSAQEHEGLSETDIAGMERAFIEAQDQLADIAHRLASHSGLQRRFVQLAASQIQCCLPGDPSLLEYLKQQLSLQ